MNLCQRHWDELRKSISTLGLDHLIARDGDAAAKRIMSQTPGNFDPLLCAWQMLVMNAARSGIFECYVCHGEKHLEKGCDDPECAAKVGYIMLATRDARAEAIRLGYAPRPLS